MASRETFSMLWKMIDEVREQQFSPRRDATGTIISRYARIIDDRINNSGHSRSVDSLKLYTYEQLQDELDERDSDNG